MKVSGESVFISCRTGEKNGKNWFSAKFLDEAADEFVTVFVSEDLYRELEGVARKTPVILTLQIVPGQKYFSLEQIEFVD